MPASPPDLAIAALSAMTAGAINAIAGGGTFLTFPTLTGVLGLSEKLANMTSTVGLWPGSIGAVAAAQRDLRQIPRRILVLYTLLSLGGGALGAALLVSTSERQFRFVIPWLLLFATVLFACAKPIAGWAGRSHGHRTTGWTLLVGAAQFMIAVYGGYFGAGIGVLMLAGLSLAGLDNLHQVNALKAFLSTAINGVAVGLFLWVGIDGAVAAAMAGGALFGGVVGMRFARSLPPAQLRTAILAVGATLTLVYFLRVYG